MAKRPKKGNESILPVRLDDETMKVLNSIVEKTRLNRSFVIQAAVRLAIKRAAKGDRAWLLNDDIEELPTVTAADPPPLEPARPRAGSPTRRSA